MFGELLDIPNVKELANTEYSPYLTLLNLFAYGTYRDYVKHRESNSQSLPELTEPMVTKLKFLSIVSLARFNRRIPYSVLMQELDTNSMRQLEDLLIDAVYADVIKGESVCEDLNRILKTVIFLLQQLWIKRVTSSRWMKPSVEM